MQQVMPRVVALRQLCSASLLGRRTFCSDGKTVDHEKTKALRHEVHSATPGWSEEHASDSEATVKAEKDPKLGVEELQKLTVHLVQEKHHKTPAQGGEEQPPPEKRDT